MLHGWLPVSATLSVVLFPAHMVAVPLIVAAGNGFTVTTALPAPLFEQVVASETAVTVYVLDVTGETTKVYGVIVIPFTVTGVVPSV
jgi:hypothetical protein